MVWPHARGTLIIVLTALVMNLGTPVATSIPPILPGDWIVEGEESYDGIIVIMHGDLVIRNGGSLTLNNVELIFRPSSNLQYEVLIEPGGTLSMNGGSIRPFDEGVRIAFRALGGMLTIEGATMNGIGHCVSEPCNEETNGLFVGGEGAIIRNSLIESGGCGVIVTGNDALVEGNTIQGNDYCGLYVAGDRAIIRGNSIDQSIVDTPGGHTLIQLSGTEGVRIENNDLKESEFPTPQDGQSGSVNGDNVLNTVITGNTIVGQRGIGIWTGSNTVVRGNDILCSEMCLFFGAGANNRGEDNRIDLRGFYHGSAWDAILVVNNIGFVLMDNEIVVTAEGAKGGITVRHGHDGWIKGNTIQVGQEVVAGFHDDVSGPDGIFLHHSTGNHIHENQVVDWSGGIVLYGGSDRNTIESNIIDSAQRGMLLLSSKNNRLADNQVANTMQGDYDVGDNEWAMTKIGGSPPTVSQWEEDRLPIYDGGIETREINGAFIEVTSGAVLPPFPERSLVIQDSILILGRDGPVQIRAAELTVERSRLIAASPGYGFTVASIDSEDGVWVMHDSTIEGAWLEDLAFPNILFDNSVVTNSSRMTMYPPVVFPNKVSVIDSTFVGVNSPLFIGSAVDTTVRGNLFVDPINGPIHVTNNPGDEGLHMRSVIVENNTVLRVWHSGGITVGGPSGMEEARVSGNFLGRSLGTVNVLSGDFAVEQNTFCEVLIPIHPGTGSWSENYYGDYSGVDADEDGYGDEPYVFSNQEQDTHPLMSPPGATCGEVNHEPEMGWIGDLSEPTDSEEGTGRASESAESDEPTNRLNIPSLTMTIVVAALFVVWKAVARKR